ncbi:E3 ubiquitin-protein ligase MIB2-like isoform X4 [Octopus vulgaris]|uniref:E3 ubiquitin-protein ligase MIB2-like isoform X4 n=1 Tax=Octopus vulgaris TaxID=6645 RepID=A0AA36HIU3_OCTVU|nr:E3 ubiquitin-protein ligase MIB2-like isoform X4 [Octopus vulgaris]
MLKQGSLQLDIKNKKERTPLLEAVSRGHLGMTHKLIALGANVNAVDGEGNSCLHLAVEREVFHSEDAPLDLLNECCTSLNLKIEERLSGIVVARYLASQGADFHHKNNNNNTPLDLIKDPNLRRKLETFLPPQCLWCKNKTATIKFLPCGHFVTCETCSRISLKRCLKCRETCNEQNWRWLPPLDRSADESQLTILDDHYMQIPRFDCKSIMKSHSSKFRPLCPAVSKILQLTDSDNDSKNLVTVSRIVEICNGIVTYSPDLKLISCATTGGDFDFHCSSNVTDMTRIGEHTVLATIPFRKKIVFINPSSFHIKSLDYSFFTISISNILHL